MEREGPPPMNDESLREAIEWAIATRRSIRAFLPTEVSRATIEEILDVARFAATGVNLQPWNVHVVTGAARTRLCAAIHAVDDTPRLAAQHSDEWEYYPTQWISPYIDRRREVGWNLYGLLGIEKGDKERMHTQHGRNYSFFDAPVGLFFTVNRVMQQGSLLDIGMFMQNVMIVARAHGLDTCPQAAFMKYHKIIRAELDVPSEEMFVVGMSLGYADNERIENTLITRREGVASFTKFHGK
ncbi:nitroreductase [Herbaspirillum sp. alder98]|uniref:nitroreductase n=1 Tax=Herbaspirillum sp. alder98 TaxID=2913096 RepID=UPI001CD843E7|nr:nitroreductase [Herbaspirillum sp. alder98]MCA1322898.1 nitroreductase [Herbaspirillum sp. alder98]